MRRMEMEEDQDGLGFFDEDSDNDNDSDEELQAAFARGELKPGLVVLDKPGGGSEKKPLVINNVPVMELKLQQIKLPKTFGWVERLDIVNGLAPLAPEIALQVDEHKTKREREIKSTKASKAGKKSAGPPSLKSIEEDPVHNDFVREMNFYRQAQEAVLKCLPRLRELGVPTKRPDDYFAEMAKSDIHMQKVAKVLHKQKVITERAEKVRKVRQQKKIAKQTQVHAIQEKQKAKRELMENVKKYRKGQKNSLDFLEEKGGSRGGKDKPRINRKREMKNERYGYGGKKKGSKWNTRESLDSFDDGFGQKGKHKRGGAMGPKVRGAKSPGNRGGISNGGKRPGSRGSSGGGPGGKRPGKRNRQKIKANRN